MNKNNPHLAETVPVKASRYDENQQPDDDRNSNTKRKKSCACSGCGCLTLLFIAAFLLLMLFPFPSQFILLGIDRSPAGTMAGRSDTMMVFSTNPLLLKVKVLSIPRDLWVPIPGMGENRINTAHFFAEAQTPGSGPAAAIETVNQNFSLNLKYHVRFNLENIPSLIDALGGISLNLPQIMSGYPSGTHRMNGEAALAFLRNRSDGDDFFRINQGQLFISGFVRELLNPGSWPRLPAFLAALPAAMDTNLPLWLWPRVGFSLGIGSLTGIETLTIDRSMVTPFTTAEGAQVLLPNWPTIDEYIKENF